MWRTEECVKDIIVTHLEKYRQINECITVESYGDGKYIARYTSIVDNRITHENFVFDVYTLRRVSDTVMYDILNDAIKTMRAII